MSIYDQFMSQNLKIRVLKSKTVAASRGAWGHCRRLCPPPTFPPSQKEKMAKISYFWQFFDICPLRYAFCPPDASTKYFSGAATGQKTTKLGFSGKLNSVFIKNKIDHRLRYKKKKKEKKKIIVWLSSTTFFEKGWAGRISVFKEIWLNISLLMTKKYEKPCLKFKKPQN